MSKSEFKSRLEFSEDNGLEGEIEAVGRHNSETGYANWEARGWAKHQGVKDLVHILVEWFRDVGGANYVVMDVKHPEDGEFSVTVQKKIGKSPAEKQAEFEKEIERLRGALGRIEGLAFSSAVHPSLQANFAIEIAREALNA